MQGNQWTGLDPAEKENIICYVEQNLALVRNDIMAFDPNLYAGNRPAEVAPGWVIIRGIDYVRDFMKG